MRLTLIIIFFLFLNFMLILFPKLMPNVISADKTLFWVFWVNGLFMLFLLLPAKASYFFPSVNRGAMITNSILRQIKKTKDDYIDPAEKIN